MSTSQKVPHQAKSLVISGVTVIGVAAAAALTSIFSDDRDVGITAWIAVAVVGTATMIATAKNSQRKPPAPPVEDQSESDGSSTTEREAIVIPQ